MIKSLVMLLALLMLGSLAAQTRVHLGTQSRVADFSGQTGTKPMQTGSLLPTTCSSGEFFFQLIAPAGRLYACSQTNFWTLVGVLPNQSGQPGRVLATDGFDTLWLALGGDVTGSISGNRVTALQNRPVSNQAPVDGQVLVWDGIEEIWKPDSAPGGVSVEVKNNGTIVGSRPVQNFIPGFGLLQILSDTGSEIGIQPSIDSAVVETRANLQAGATLACVSIETAGPDFNCQLNPSLTAYPEAGGLFFWKPAASAYGSLVNLNIDTLGGKPVTMMDGVTPLAEGDLEAGVVQPLWYDGMKFRLLTASPLVRSEIVRPDCTSDLRGRLWHQPSETGVADSVAVCAKDASESYAWRALY